MRTVGHLPDSILGLTGLSVSPNGKEVAYLAYPGCRHGSPTPTTTAARGNTSAGTPASADDYVAVRNLATGKTVQATYPEQGDATAGNGPIWSPDGTRLAVVSASGTKALVFSASDPSLHDARAIQVPPRCSLSAIGAWTSAGITESLDCEAAAVGHSRPMKQPKQWNILRQITTAGHTTYSTKLSACNAVDSIESSTPGSPAIVDSVNSPLLDTRVCTAPATRIAEYENGHLRTVLLSQNTVITTPS